MNGESLLRVNETQFLGVIINCKLSWSNLIKPITSKIGKSIGIVYKIRCILNEVSCLHCNYIEALLNHT